jgi:hypothetical protein
MAASIGLGSFGIGPDPNAPPPIEPGWRCVSVVRSYAPGMILRAALSPTFVVIQRPSLF